MNKIVRNFITFENFNKFDKFLKDSLPKTHYVKKEKKRDKNVVKRVLLFNVNRFSTFYNDIWENIFFWIVLKFQGSHLNA